jgi:predicted transposase/invertase (TIGR01784 family)
MGHDQLFKDFLRAFLQEFLELVYPELAERLDFKTLHLLDKELFTDFPEGTTREADLVAEIETRDGSPRLVVIHIEVQLRTKPDFPERMYRYFTMLWLRHAVPIVPIVIYLRGGREGVAVHEYMMHSFELEQVRFRYRSVALARLDAQSYVDRGNPVAAALAALMNRRGAKDTLTLRAVMLRRVAESTVDNARKLLLANMIETYFRLAPKHKERFSGIMSQEGYREAQKMRLTWADEMKEEGRKEGRLEGLAEGKRVALIQLLTMKFDTVPDATRARVHSLSLDELDTYLKRALSVETLEEMGLG